MRISKLAAHHGLEVHNQVSQARFFACLLAYATGSGPQDFEHFLHVGFTNLKDASRLAQTQQQAFEEVAARRHRKLPNIPVDQKSARKRRMKQENEAKLGEPLTKHERDLFDSIIASIQAGESDNVADILATTDFDVNRRDEDGHTILDFAVMINEAKCIQMILEFGGLENAQYLDPSNRETRLKEILDDARVSLGLFSELEPCLFIQSVPGQTRCCKRGASAWDKDAERSREAACHT